MGETEYNVALNSSPDSVKLFEQIPVKVINGQPVLLGDVAKVSDSYAEQTNIVRVNRKSSSLPYHIKKSECFYPGSS